MTSLDYLKALLKTIGVDEEDDAFLELMLDEAQKIFKHLTNRTNYSKYQSAIARIAFFNYQKLGDEAKKSYSAGSVSISYSEIREALKGYLPPPLILLGGKKADCDALSLDYEEFITKTARTFQEQQQMIDNLKAEIEALKKG